MKRRRSRGRVLWFAVLATLFGVALFFFPLRGKGGHARAAEDGPAKAAAPAKKVKKVAPPPAAAAADAPAGADDAGVAGVAGVAVEAGSAGDAGDAGAKSEPVDLHSVPVGRGLPVAVNVGVFFLDVLGYDDTKGDFEATVDLRLRWRDPRLRYPAKETLRGYKEHLGKDAEEALAKIWSPTIDVLNRIEGEVSGSTYVGRRFRVYPDGTVEVMTRTTAHHKGHVDVESFPFDRQKLPVELIVRDDTTDEVLLRFDKDDVAFSRISDDARMDGWTPGIVDLRSDQVPGWNGDRYSRVTASLLVDRIAASSLAPIFIPLLASLLIPLLAIWMNKAEGDEFEVDAFELANMGIGGLFSVIALSFAIYSSYTVIANGDNTVTRLFGLNYAMLAITLGIVVVCFRFNIVARLFGEHVQKEFFHYLLWSLPVLSLATSAAFLLVAAA